MATRNTKDHEFSGLYKKKGIDVDKRALRAHVRTQEQKSKRDVGLSKRRKIDDISPLKETTNKLVPDSKNKSKDELLKKKGMDRLQMLKKWKEEKELKKKLESQKKKPSFKVTRATHTEEVSVDKIKNIPKPGKTAPVKPPPVKPASKPLPKKPATKPIAKSLPKPLAAKPTKPAAKSKTKNSSPKKKTPPKVEVKIRSTRGTNLAVAKKIETVVTKKAGPSKPATSKQASTKSKKSTMERLTAQDVIKTLVVEYKQPMDVDAAPEEKVLPITLSAKVSRRVSTTCKEDEDNSFLKSIPSSQRMTRRSIVSSLANQFDEVDNESETAHDPENQSPRASPVKLTPVYTPVVSNGESLNVSVSRRRSLRSKENTEEDIPVPVMTPEKDVESDHFKRIQSSLRKELRKSATKILRSESSVESTESSQSETCDDGNSSILRRSRRKSRQPHVSFTSSKVSFNETVEQMDQDENAAEEVTAFPKTPVPLLRSGSKKRVNTPYLATPRLRSIMSPEEQAIDILAKSPMIELSRKKAKTPENNQSFVQPDFEDCNDLPPLPQQTDEEVRMLSEDPANNSEMSSSESVSAPEVIPDTEVVAENTTTEPVVHDVPYFRQLLVSETERLNAFCNQWNMILDMNPALNDEVTGMIRTTVGQAHLLMKERFKQFIGLVDNCEFNTGEKETTCMDLQGFWEMIYYQVEDVNKKFKRLDVLQAREWLDSPKPVQQKPKPKKIVVKPAKSKVGGKSRFAAFRAKMKQQKESANVAIPEVDEAGPQTGSLTPEVQAMSLNGSARRKSRRLSSARTPKAVTFSSPAVSGSKQAKTPGSSRRRSTRRSSIIESPKSNTPTTPVPCKDPFAFDDSGDVPLVNMPTFSNLRVNYTPGAVDPRKISLLPFTPPVIRHPMSSVDDLLSFTPSATPKIRSVRRTPRRRSSIQFQDSPVVDDLIKF